MKLLKIIFFLIIINFVHGCGPIKFSQNEEFYFSIFATGNDPIYIKEDRYQGKDFYTLNPRMSTKFYSNPGMLLGSMNSKGQQMISQLLTEQEVLEIRREISIQKLQTQVKIVEQQKIEAEQQRIEKIKTEQEVKQKIIKAALDEQNRIKELKSRKYSLLPAKISVTKNSTHVIVTSIDDNPFLVERVVRNNRTGVDNCDWKGIHSLSTGDTVRFSHEFCGDTLVKVDIYTNRGSSGYSFK